MSNVHNDVVKSTGSQVPKVKLDSIQCCRALAFLMVILLHRPPSWEIFNITQYGRYGVMMFFIISGFIITYLHLNNNIESVKAFAIKRIVRLYPVYLTSTVICVAVSYYIYVTGFSGWSPLEKFNEIGWVTTLTLLPVNDGHAVNFLAWSLVYEIWYYILFGLAIYLLKGRFIIGVLLYAALLILANAFNVVGFSSSGTFVNLVVVFSPLNLFFIISALIAYIMFDKNGEFRRSCILTFFACYLAIIFFGGSYTLGSLGGYTTEFFLLTVSIAIVVGSLLIEKTGKVKFPGVIVYLGNMTYSLYLIHYVYLFCFGVVIDRFFPSANKDSTSSVMVYYVSLLVICFVVYKYFELPSGRYLRKRFLRTS